MPFNCFASSRLRISLKETRSSGRPWVAGKRSSVTIAGYKQFGDAFRHPPRTAAHTLAQLRELEKLADPLDELATYVKNAKAVGLNGVHKPFWADYPMADPAIFLTARDLAPLAQNVLGPPLQMPLQGGISKGKQTTGREHRDIQRYLVPVIAGVVSKPFLTSIASLNDFFYVGQAPEIDDEESWTAKARKGKNGPIENCIYRKLEFLQSVVPAIRASGVPLQWSADVTEHAHITLIKDPASNTNNQNYEPQIVRHLDRKDKLRQFNLATAIDALAGLQDDDGNDDGDGEPSRLVNSTSQLLDLIDPVVRLAGTGRKKVDYFRTITVGCRCNPLQDPGPAFALYRPIYIDIKKAPSCLRLTSVAGYRLPTHIYLSTRLKSGTVYGSNLDLSTNQDNILEPETVNAVKAWLGPSNAGVLLITWTDEWNAASTSHNH
ncbi:hypothetical protein B0H14DRAFT_2623715 [Mycena olivaceomarginata]|nr:hypothetical protein B0H14DRAFT_2623715 [Mycena olivaceomarginata]